MIFNIDLLGIPCAEYCEHNGVKGIFIPEVPNFRFIKGDKRKPDRAILKTSVFRTQHKAQSYDYMGRMDVLPEHRDAYMANPNTVNRKRYMLYGYNFTKGKDETPAPVSNAEDFARILDD